MPKKRQVPTLEELAFRSVGQFVTTVGRHMMKQIRLISSKNPSQESITLNSWIEWMKQQLVSSVPWYHWDRMSVETLKAVMNLINEKANTINDSEKEVALNLIKVIVHSRLKAIEFSAVWPEYVHDNLSGLEILDLGYKHRSTCDVEKMIIGGVSAMPNLTSFTQRNDCTDSIVAAVARN